MGIALIWATHEMRRGVTKKGLTHCRCKVKGEWTGSPRWTSEADMECTCRIRWECRWKWVLCANLVKAAVECCQNFVSRRSVRISSLLDVPGWR